MYKGKNILAVVMARGGSKGIKNKNLKKIRSKSLVAIAGQLLSKVKIIDRSIISTDSVKIAKEAKKNFLSFFFKRPQNLSGDFVSDFKVMYHSLKFMEKFDKKKFDIVLMIQPTSPMRNKSIILQCIKKVVKSKVSSCWTVNEVNSKLHPFKQLIFKGNFLNYFDKKGKKIIARQQLKPTYFRNGLCYAIRRETILKDKNLLGKKALAIITKKNVINIDSFDELRLARKLNYAI